MPTPASVASDSALLAAHYRAVRSATEALAAPLCVEDMVVQTMPDVSPTKWHLAHTSWFFETFVLAARPGYRSFHDDYDVLFNSYYNAVGPQFPRVARGLLSRPTVADVRRYRAHVDAAMLELLERGQLDTDTARVVELGLHHEQQHQELVLTDVKHVLGSNPLWPAYRAPHTAPALAVTDAPPLAWLQVAGGVFEMGVQPGAGFAFDNESPRHRVLVEDFELASRPVTNGEFLAFVEAEGYRTPALWLSEGWAAIAREGWAAPAYWVEREGQWHEFGLHGLAPLDLAAPVCHLSLYEADAYAQWAGARLPTEAEWERAATRFEVDTSPERGAGSFVEDGHLRPVPSQAPAAVRARGPLQMLGDIWEWTRSSYDPYPGFRAAPGALGEYNGKFMCAQMVLRGGSCATPRAHIRASYRNFFPAHARWQFSGVRLAR